MDREGQLWFWCRVILLEGFQDVGKWQVKVVATGGASRVVKSSQYAGLGHVTEGFFDGLGTNRPTRPKESSSNPGGKAQEQLLLNSAGAGGQPWVDVTFVAVTGPPTPTGMAGGIVHRGNCNRCPRKVKITLDICSGMGRARCQDVRLGNKGKRVAKCVRKWESSGRSEMGRDAMSARIFDFPAMWNTWSGPASNDRWRMASPRSNLWAASDFAVLVAIVVAQATLGELSL